VYAWLLDRAGTESGRSEEELYYALALGRLEDVATALTALLSSAPVPAWLRLLHAVTAAPRRDQDPRPPSEVVAALLPHDEQDEPVRTPMLRLVAGLWVTGDPLCGSNRSRAYERVAAALSESRPVGLESDEFDDEIRRYQELAAKW
jgi:hypothetical protein